MTTADGAPTSSERPPQGYPRGGYVPGSFQGRPARGHIAAGSTPFDGGSHEDLARRVNQPDSAPLGELMSAGVPHAKLYAARAWIAIVRDVLIILILLAFAFLGGRLVSAQASDEPAACVEISTGSSGTVCAPGTGE